MLYPTELRDHGAKITKPSVGGKPQAAGRQKANGWHVVLGSANVYFQRFCNLRARRFFV